MGYPNPGLSATDPPRIYRFNPDVGRWRIELARLARFLSSPTTEIGSRLDDKVDELVPSPAKPATPDKMRLAFALSLLSDIVRAGGIVRVIDSVIHVSWPDWSDENGRQLTRRALRTLAGYRVATDAEKRRLGGLFVQSLAPHALLEFLTRGRFWLESANVKHPSGVRYGDAFALAKRLWTMPLRDRPARNRWFVVVGQHDRLCPVPVITGLIEVGDDAPYNTQRDRFLGLHPREFLSWLQEHPQRKELAPVLVKRLRALRHSLLHIPATNASASAKDILAHQGELLKFASGRSQSDKDFEVKKRIAYMVRLAHGEAAFAQIAKMGRDAVSDYSLREGIRAIHDLTVPRVHMEVTICGAVPPFNSGLAGKLVVAFLGHPDILDVLRNGGGSITGKVFHTERIASLLPNWGILALTTKGLYPHHSAMYNRATIPGVRRPLRLRKIGETSGVTATLLGDRTAKMARLLMESATPARQVSQTYGTGGAKRQRYIESALLSTGLPGTFAHAGIRRPIYGVGFVENMASVIWALQEPIWLVDRVADSSQYSEHALELWRDRWLGAARRRLMETSVQLPGVVEMLSRQCADLGDEPAG